VGIDRFIEGIPYGQRKVRGNIYAADKWTQVVKRATKNLPKVKGPVRMNLEFVLPEDKYPSDHPYGPDLDNLLKRLLDALNTTVFSKVPGMDGAVEQLIVSKRKAKGNEPMGVRVILNEL